MSEELVKEFQAAYLQEGKNNITVQTPYLSKLAEVYEKRASDDPLENWTSVLKAHALYNSCSARSAGTACALEYQLNSFRIQNSYNKAHQLPEVSFAQLLLLKTAHKLQLHAIREKYRREVAPLNILIETYQTAPEHLCSEQNQQIDTEFCNRMESVSRRCTGDMVEFIQHIIEDAIQLLQAHPPCGLAVIGLGSLAREEGTPYSDLEFFFLVERKDPTMMRYFENLAMTIYFLIGNLQETTLKYMSIGELKGWFEDCSKNGFRIDGLQDKAGNIPTGNGTTNPKNKWICTLQELTERYKAVYTGQEPISHKDKDIVGDLADMMAFLKLIYSWGVKGRQQYIELECMVDTIPGNESRILKTIGTARQDAKTYFWDPLDSLPQNREMMNVKTDFYRLPSLLTVGVKMLLRLKSSSPLEMLNTYSDEVRSWKAMLSIALFARLSAYLHYDGQHELISIHRRNSLNAGDAPGRWHMPWSALVAYCVNYYEFKHQSTDENELFKQEIKYKAVVHAAMALADTHLTATYAQHVSFECFTFLHSMKSVHVVYIADAFLQSKMYSKCICLLEKLQQSVVNESTCNKAAIYSLMFAANAFLGLHKETAKWKRELMTLGVEHLTISENSCLITSLYILKVSNITTGFDVSIIPKYEVDVIPQSDLHLMVPLHYINDDCHKAIEYSMMYEEYINKLFGNDMLSVKTIYTLLQRAQCYHCLADHTTSLKLFKEVLVIKMKLYGSQFNYNYGPSYENISLLYFMCKQYKRAETSALEALKMYKKYGLGTRIKTMYVHLAKIYRELGDAAMCTAYQRRAMERKSSSLDLTDFG